MSERFNFVLEPADAEIAAWLRGQSNMSAVIRAALVEHRERIGQLARIEAKLDLLLSRTEPRINISVDNLSDVDRERLDDLLRRYGTTDG